MTNTHIIGKKLVTIDTVLFIGNKLSIAIIKTYIFYNLVYCSSKNNGINVKMLYFVVLILF